MNRPRLRTEVAIVGAGLSGLQAARLLTRQGTECVVLDARTRAGGRILSAALPAEAGRPRERYDVGPAWFWPDMQPLMQDLVRDLGLTAFPQQTEGAFLVERFTLERPQRYERGVNQSPQSMRLEGGMQALVEAIVTRLPAGALKLSTQVRSVTRTATGHIKLEAMSDDGPVVISADRVILALPPRLIVERITLEPRLPEEVRSTLTGVPTWMAGQAKIMAVYDRPFWLERGFSGMASSFVGPMSEIHDASCQGGRPALFGFIGMPHAARHAMGRDALKKAALLQLTRLFGGEASHPVALILTDWAEETHTSVSADTHGASPHFRGLSPGYGRLWDGRLLLAGSEMAERHSGYLEGALEAAEAATRPSAEPRPS